MQDLIDDSNAAFASTTGFSVSGFVDWTADTLIKPFLGAVVGTLYALRYWIMAFVVISIVIYFSYRAFRAPKA